MGISTHILDTARGKPVEGVQVTVSAAEGSSFRELARGVTNADGRVKPLLESIPAAGEYRLTFEVDSYFAGLGVNAFYRRVTVDFRVAAPAEHFHVPLLLNPFGYSTYRGS